MPVPPFDRCSKIQSHVSRMGFLLHEDLYQNSMKSADDTQPSWHKLQARNRYLAAIRTSHCHWLRTLGHCRSLHVRAPVRLFYRLHMPIIAENIFWRSLMVLHWDPHLRYTCRPHTTRENRTESTKIFCLDSLGAPTATTNMTSKKRYAWHAYAFIPYF